MSHGKIDIAPDNVWFEFTAGSVAKKPGWTK
jgi:hypothetical protein